MKTRIIVSLVIFLVAITSSFAQARADVRQKSQRIRIHEGRQNCEITRKETRLLNKQQRHIRRNEYRANADGNVSARENAQLERKQDRASRSIYRAKHNDIERKD
jgi:uncharacterized membrane protein